jgi:hypothetical protein
MPRPFSPDLKTTLTWYTVFSPGGHHVLAIDKGAAQTSLKWYSTIAVLSGTLAPAGTFLKNNDKICPAD